MDYGVYNVYAYVRVWERNECVCVCVMWRPERDLKRKDKREVKETKSYLFIWLKEWWVELLIGRGVVLTLQKGSTKEGNKLCTEEGVGGRESMRMKGRKRYLSRADEEKIFE